MIEKIKRQGTGYLVGLIGVALALVGDIAYIASDYGDRTFSWLVVALVVLAAVLYAAKLFFDFPQTVLLSSFALSAATALSVHLMLPTLSDIWNNVHFIGGNPVQTVVFTSLFFLSDVATIVSCFLMKK